MKKKFPDVGIMEEQNEKCKWPLQRTLQYNTNKNLTPTPKLCKSF